MEQSVEKLREVSIRGRLFHNSSSRHVIHVKCPFHQEKSASLALYKDNSYYCFGCKAHGKGAIDFVMGMGCNFIQACEELKKLI